MFIIISFLAVLTAVISVATFQKLQFGLLPASDNNRSEATDLNNSENCPAYVTESSKQTGPESKETEQFPPTDLSSKKDVEKTNDSVETEDEVRITRDPSSAAAASGSISDSHVHQWEPVYKTVHHDAVTHTVHHDAVTHVVHHDAVTHVVHHDAEYGQRWVETSPARHVYKCNICGAEFSNGHDANMHLATAHDDYDGPVDGWTGVDYPAEGHYENYLIKDAWDETVTDSAAWDETVVDKTAWDEVIVDKPAYDEQVFAGYKCSCGKTK